LGVGAMLLFEDRIKGGVADTTKEIGRQVEEAGETIQHQGSKLR